MRIFVRRLAMLIVSLLEASFVIFAAIYLAPGNPIAALSGGRSIPPDSLRVLEARYHLDQPFLVQYWYWLTNALHGNLGISITLRENVSDLIASRISTTAGLVLYSSILIIAIGVGLGIVSGLRPGFIDNSVLVVTAISASLPAFVAAIVLILVFAVQLQWFPSLGNGVGFFDQVRHLTLPAVVMGLTTVGGTTRFIRASLLEVMSQDYIRAARAKGLSERRVVWVHGMRNAAVPLIQVFAITLPVLLSGALLIEVVFSWPGLGQLLFNAILTRDYPLILGATSLSAAMVILGNLLADVLHALVDPRVRDA